MYREDTTAVDGTAVRVAFWRTLRVEVDPPRDGVPQLLDAEGNVGAGP
jgi:hypothetical protein